MGASAGITNSATLLRPSGQLVLRKKTGERVKENLRPLHSVVYVPLGPDIDSSNAFLRGSKQETGSKRGYPCDLWA